MSSYLPHQNWFVLRVYSEQPSDHWSVAVPSRSVHPDSDKARIPSASVLNTFGVMGSADFRAGACTPRTCPADGTASTMSASPWSGRSPSVAARVAGYPRGGLGGGIRTAKSTGNHCGGHATPRMGSCGFELYNTLLSRHPPECFAMTAAAPPVLLAVAPGSHVASISNRAVRKLREDSFAWWWNSGEHCECAPEGIVHRLRRVRERRVRGGLCGAECGGCEGGA